MNKAFDKILERLQEQAKIYQESIERQHSIDYRWIEEEGLQATEEAIDIINQVEDEYNNGWIPCSERLPDDLIDVLVWFEYYRFGNYNGLYQTIGISYTNNGEWSRLVNGTSGWKELRIIAWQPLPQPPKGE